MTTFSKLYNKLNPKQKEAVDTIDGPVMIVAGPGTGKTTTLTMRIANILKKTDTSPASVLALTFTESGVKAMRERLVEIIGPTAYYVNISTFHSFCTEVIKEFPEVFLISDEASPLSELERIELFKRIIDETDLDVLRPINSAYFYLQDIIKAIQDLKRENIGAKQFEKLIAASAKGLEEVTDKVNPRTGKPYTKYAKQEMEIRKQKELLKIYIDYQKRLKEIQRFDFEDMINFVVLKLSQDENLKLTLQEKYLYILVDEYQDTNNAQNQLIRLLTDSWESPNIFVVGDDEQSIFRFQGASIENIIYFTELFEKAKVITLTDNYRSSQHILNASRSLIERNLLKLDNIDKKLVSQVDHPNVPLALAALSNGQCENQFIALKAKELIEKGTDPDCIAVIVRNNSDLEDIADTFSQMSIRHEVSSGKNILDSGDISRLFILLQVIADLGNKPNDDIDLFTLLNLEFLKFNKLDILKLCRFASGRRLNLVDAIIDKDIFNEIDLEESEKFIKFIDELKEWKSLDANATFTKFFEQVIQQSGFLDWILNDKYNVSRMNTLNTLFEEIKSLNLADHSLNLSAFLQNINLMREHNVPIREQSIEPDVQAVKLITAHKSKGLEFDYVFIAKCIDKKWGNNPSHDKIKLPENVIKSANLDKKDKNEDERRLFYVALTRAKRQVLISYAETYTYAGMIRQAVPSLFISELGSKFTEKIDTSKFETSLAKNLAARIKPHVSLKEIIKEEDFLKGVISDLALNVTSLNTYLACHYKFKLNTILRTPRAKSSSLAFGSAVHKALELYFKRFKVNKKLPPLDYLLDSFAKALQKELLTQEDYDRLIKKGNNVLNEYYQKNYKDFSEPLYLEYPFGFKQVHLGDIPLSGKIDKIEWVNKQKRTVKVVDYKTGTPRTRGEIEGKTKFSHGDLQRQLLFYKLLSVLDKNFNYDVTCGEFDFLQSRGTKAAKKEVYQYSVEQVEELKTLVKENMERIRKLEFERTTDYNNCKNCDFKSHCWPDGVPKISQKANSRRG